MFDLADVEEGIAWDAAAYVAPRVTDEDIIGQHQIVQNLAEIQHFGGATNLIDFTDDYVIA
ncbi:MAG: hypothetical protein OXH52_04475 [Gammaproteobacteria bacterium]|nr:hypothetical protein [Gammaproteobacteria bacterium]